MDLETFMTCPQEQVARLVGELGPRVCVFPINGTRRWFMLEYGGERNDAGNGYLEAIIGRHIELYQMFFDLGVPTLLTPALGADIVERGEEYMRVAAYGLSQLASHPAFLAFYRQYRVRVRFYGAYEKNLAGTPYAYLIDLFRQVTALTEAHDRHRLFFGLFANDATETIAELAVTHCARHGRVPNRQTLVKLYYGEPVEPVDVFIGFDRLAAFDMPLIALGSEDLYFTVSPSPYLTERQLREIVYDHLYRRRRVEPDYETMSAADRARMKDFYRANIGRTIGVGGMDDGPGGFWYPLPQVELPGPTGHNNTEH